MKRILLVVLISLSSIHLYSLESPVTIQGIEVAYGAYDVMAGLNLQILEWDFWKIKPTFRLNVFYNSYKIGIWNEYFPLTHFNVGFWIFNSDQINPYVLLGFQIPTDFASLSTPIGVGVQLPLLKGFNLGFRLYSDMLIVPTYYSSASWDVYFEFEF